MDSNFKGALSMIAQASVQRVMGLFTTLLMARLLTVSELGIIAVMINTANSGYGFLRMGVDAALHVSTAQAHIGESQKEEKNRFLGAGLFLLLSSGLSGLIVCLTAAPWIAENIYGNEVVKGWIMLSSVLLLFQCIMQYVHSVLVGFQRYAVYASLTMVLSFPTLLLTTGFCWAYGIKGAVASQILSMGVSILLMAWTVRKALIEEDLRLSFDRIWASSFKLLGFGFPFYLSGVIAIPVTYYLQGILVKSHGLDVMGVFRVMGTVIALVSFVPVSIAPVLISSLTRKSSLSDSDFAVTSVTNLKFIWIFTILVGVLTAGVFPSLILPFFGSQYHVYRDIVGVSVAAAVCNVIFSIIGSIALSRKRINYLFAFSTVSSLFCFVTGILLISDLGIRGFYFAELSGNIASFAFIYFSSRDWRSRHLRGSHWVPVATFATICVFLVLISSPWFLGGLSNILFSVLLSLLVGAIAYAGVLDEFERGHLRRRLFLFEGDRPV